MMKQQTEDHKKELITIFFAQKDIILSTTLLIFFCSILIGFYWPPTYAAYGEILVKGKKAERSASTLENEIVAVRPISTQDLYSEIQILTSPEVIIRTIKDLKEKKLYPDNVKKTGPLDIAKKEINKTIEKINYYLEERSLLPGRKVEAILDPGEENLKAEVRRINSSLKTKVSPASNVINLSYYHNEPKFAVTLLAALMAQYIEYRTQVFNPIEAKNFFSQQAEKFRKELGEKEDELMRLVEKTGLSDPLKEIENNLSIKKDFELKLNAFKEEALGEKIFIAHLEKALNKEGIQFFSFLKDSPIHSPDGLSANLQHLVNERENALRIYQSSSNKPKALEEEIARQYARLRSEVEKYKENKTNELRILEEKIANLEDNIIGLNARNIDLKKQHLLAERINTESKMLMGSYETFSKRREEAVINSSGGASNFFISVLKNAVPSNGPDFPKKDVVIPLGLIVGIMTGCSLGFVREFLDHTFKKPSDTINYAQAQLIFSIPEFEEINLVKKPDREEPSPEPSEEMAALQEDEILGIALDGETPRKNGGKISFSGLLAMALLLLTVSLVSLLLFYPSAIKLPLELKGLEWLQSMVPRQIK